MSRISALATTVHKSNATDAEDLDDSTLGSSGSRQIPVPDKHGQFANNKAPRGGVAFDGTASTKISSALTNQNIATDPFSVVVVVQVPLANPSVVAGIAGLAADNSPANDASSWVMHIDTAGTLFCYINGTTGNNNYCFSGSFVANYAGKAVVLTFVRPASGNATLYINGVVPSNLGFASTGTPPTWQYSITSTFLTVGSINSASVYVGKIFSASLYNLALAAADVLEIMELGGAVPERFKFGNQAGIYTSNFTSSADGWVIEGGTDTLAEVSGQLQWTTTTGTNGIARSSGGYPTALARAIRIKFDFQLISGVCGAFRVWDSVASSTAFPNSAAPAAGVQTYDQIAVAGTGASGFIWLDPVSITPGAVLGVQNVRVLQVGAICHLPLDDGYSYHLRDLSTNKLHAVMSSAGCSHVLDVGKPKHIRGTTSTNGNQQMLGAPLIPANSQILRIRLRSESGTPTVQLGNASAGAQLAASVALSTTWKDITIALTGGIVTADTSVWVNSNTVDVVDIDISAEPLST